MHDDPAPAVSPDDPRAAEVARALRGLAAISPNALAEFDKFHKLGSGEVEECAPFLRRYYNDMDSVLFASYGRPKNGCNPRGQAPSERARPQPCRPDRESA